MFKEENNMKFKKFMALGLVAAMTATLFAGCGSKGNDSADTTQKSDSASADGLVSYSDIVLGETGKDLSATITMFNHRTDMDTRKNVSGKHAQNPEYHSGSLSFPPNLHPPFRINTKPPRSLHPVQIQGTAVLVRRAAVQKRYCHPC